jgi:hypothetical protein
VLERLPWFCSTHHGEDTRGKQNGLSSDVRPQTELANKCFRSDLAYHKNSMYKGKAFPQHTYGGAGGGCIAPTHSRPRVQLSASRPGRALPPGKGPPVPIVQEAGWAPEPVWTLRLEEKSFCLCRGSNLYRPVVQSVSRHYTA